VAPSPLRESDIGGRESANVAALECEIRVTGPVATGMLDVLADLQAFTQSVETVPRVRARPSCTDRHHPPVAGFGSRTAWSPTPLNRRSLVDERSGRGPAGRRSGAGDEIQVAGPIRPVEASSTPGSTSVAVPTAPILAGTEARPDDPLSVIDLLTARGLAPIDLRSNPHDGADEPPPAAPVTDCRCFRRPP